jgi:hypothetical protein
MAIPQEAPAQEAAETPPAEGGDSSQQFAEMVSNLNDGLSMVAQLAQSIDPESAQAFQQIGQQFQKAVDGLAQKMGGAQPQGPGMAAPEQGMSGKPAGPTY